MSEQNKNTVRRSIEELWNKKNLGVANEILTSDFRNIDPATKNLGAGPENHKKLVGMYTNAFPDLHFTIEDLIAEGDRVVVRWTSTGTHQGDLLGISPTNRKVTTSGTTVCRLSNGKIAEEWVVWDALGFFQQLGVVAQIESIEHAA